MSDDKVHPSELLEFGTVLSQLSKGQSLHIEDGSQSLSVEASNTAPHDSRMKVDVQCDTSNEEAFRSASFDSIVLPQMGGAALAANQSEHNLTFLQAVQIYPKAIAWSLVISLAIIMEGYDTALVSSFYAFKRFQQDYGIPIGGGNYQITTKWQGALSNGAATSSIIGLILNGFLTERFGYRYTMLGALVALAAAIFLSFFAFNIQTLLASQILSGVPWGVFSTLTTSYAAEIMPINLRVYLTSNVNQCWLIGQLTALAILRGLLDWDSSWAYRIPFGLQWVWIVIVIIGTLFAPESPWWLLQNNRPDEAKKVLLRLTRRNLGFNADNTIAIMEHTNSLERQIHNKHNRNSRDRPQTSYLDCFRGTNFRRTEIACMIFVTQNLCGLPLIGYAAYLYRQIGFNEHQSFDLSLGMQGLAILASLVSLVLMRYIGRRPLYIGGLLLCLIVLVAAGSIATFPPTTPRLWAIAGLLISLIFIFDATVGPLTYCIIAEIPSTRLRVKTIVLARIAYNLSGIITNILIQHMLNPTAWNWQGKSCFFCAITCGLCLVYCYFRLPETRGLGYHEIDMLFEKKTEARGFARLQKVLEQNGYYSFDEDPITAARRGERRKSFTTLWHS